MRPRRFRPGKGGRTLAYLPPNIAASMRPRRFRPGKGTVWNEGKIQLSKLQ